MNRNRRLVSGGCIGEQSNMDPFLDIISNVVGILIVVAVLIALSVSAATTSVYAPMLYAAPKNSNRHFFYCLDGRVALSEGSELLDQLELHARRHYGQNWRWDYPDVERAIKLWDKNEYQGNYFYIDRFNLYPQSEKASFVLKILPEGASDDIKKLRSGNSEFHRFLETKSPQSDLLHFYVSPDSFLEFQKARDIAKKKGFHVALTVLAEEEIEFIFVNYRSSGDIPPQ